MPLTIRQAETSEDRERVFRFRYEIYVEDMRHPQVEQTNNDHGTPQQNQPQIR